MIKFEKENQLFSFDDNGMYRDPNEPMVYDFVTRLRNFGEYVNQGIFCKKPILYKTTKTRILNYAIIQRNIHKKCQKATRKAKFCYSNITKI